MAFIYPLDMNNSTAYGNSFVLFKTYAWKESQAATAGTSGNNSTVPPPNNTSSGNPVNGQSGSSGTTNPMTNTPADLTSKYTGSKLGGLVPPVKIMGDYIQLYIPNNFAISYNTVWEEEMFPVAGHLIDAAVSAATGKSAATVWDELGAGTAAALIQKAQQKIKGANYFASATGMTPNPKKTMLFKDVAFREFQFNYDFFVKNKDEADTVRAIIHKFKRAMHPNMPAKFLYNYPDEFIIEYYANNELNPYLHMHKRCVLVGMDVKYTPQNLWVSHADGSFTNASMVLRFKEVELITQDDFPIVPNSKQPSF